jgi:hypothetical protein
MLEGDHLTYRAMGGMGALSIQDRQVAVVGILIFLTVLCSAHGLAPQQCASRTVAVQQRNRRPDFDEPAVFHVPDHIGIFYLFDPVADEQNRALIALQNMFDQMARFGVQIGVELIQN